MEKEDVKNQAGARRKLKIKIRGIVHHRKRTTARTKAKYDAKSFSKLRELKESDYTIVRVLGEGAFGTAYLAQAQRSNSQQAPLAQDKKKQMVVIKEIHGEYEYRRSKERNLEKFRQELSILHRLKRLCRKQLVPCYVGYFWKSIAAEDDPTYGHWSFVTNYLGDELMSLGGFLFREQEEGRSEAERWRSFKIITSNLINGMKQIHALDVTHADVNYGNILIHPATLKITFIDFGLACYKGFCHDRLYNKDYDVWRSDDWKHIVRAIIKLLDTLNLPEVVRDLNQYLHTFNLGDVQLSVRSGSILGIPSLQPLILRIQR